MPGAMSAIGYNGSNSRQYRCTRRTLRILSLTSRLTKKGSDHHKSVTM